MTAPLYHLGRFCVRRNKLVLAAWVAAAVVLALLGNAAGHRTSDNLTLPGTGSTKATNVLQANLPAQANGTNPLVIKATAGQLTGQSDEQAISQTVAALQKTPHVTKAVDPFGQGASNLVSKNGQIAYIPVTLNVSPSQLTNSEAQAVLNAAGPARQAGLQVSLGGYAGQQLSKPSTGASDVIGLAAAVVILLLALGTATAMALPIITALLGLIITLSFVSLLGQAAEVPTAAPTLATMIGLGVGIDYALFIVTRHRLQLRDGLRIDESIARATATAGGAVVFAGTTVVIALCSMWLAGIPLVTTLGYTAAISVGVAVLGATTLLPALLGALGPRINSLKVTLGRRHPDDHQPHGWRRWAQAVAQRPWRSLAASGAVLVALAIPMLGLRLGQSDVGALPTSTTARQAYDGLTAGFGAGANGPLLIAAQLGSPAKPAAPGKSPATDPRLQRLSSAIQHAPDVKHVSAPTLDHSGNTAVYTVIAGSAPSSQRTSQLVTYLRSTAIPAATKGTNVTASVGGQTASYVDLASRISSKLPMMIGVVVALSFIVLMLAFGSLVVPAKAALMNLLSVGAAYGVVTAVFQNGHGAGAIGLDQAIPIVSYVPLLMFAILFGLSMDYEVFLLSQIQEHYRATGRPVRAVIDGLANTGRVITSAALIMVCVFTSFVLDGSPIVKEFGVGLAVAIAIDATLVRCLLVPAVMTLLGKASWWMPGWLGRRLPRIRIEGEGYFSPEPAAAAPGATHAGPRSTPVTEQ
jgi:putative drug exporter of the RND superfamily